MKAKILLLSVLVLFFKQINSQTKYEDLRPASENIVLSADDKYLATCSWRVYIYRFIFISLMRLNL